MVKNWKSGVYRYRTFEDFLSWWLNQPIWKISKGYSKQLHLSLVGANHLANVCQYQLPSIDISHLNLASWWWNQPICKIWWSTWEFSANRGEHKKTYGWHLHLVIHTKNRKITVSVGDLYIKTILLCRSLLLPTGSTTLILVFHFFMFGSSSSAKHQ